MQKSLELLKLNDDQSRDRMPVDLACNECGGTFEKPILATVSVNGRLQKYYACPHCLTKIVEDHKAITVSKKNIKKPSAELKNNVECNHFFGYLKKRPKNEPFPDECLTCDKMIECLSS